MIMLTKEDDGSRVVEAINQGASDYIVKPFTEEVVATKLEKLLLKR